MSTTQEITSKLWSMANELRGNMDASEFKNYILAFMFYRYLSINQAKYIQENELIDVLDHQTFNEAYSQFESDIDFPVLKQEVLQALGYVILPADTWDSLVYRIDNSEVVPSDYQAIFEHFNQNVISNEHSVKDFSGVFNDINLSDSKLGATVVARAKALNAIVKLVDTIEYTSEDGRDILGEIYEYLIGQFAASAGKKGGEFYTPHQVSQILAKLVTLGVTNESKSFTVYDPTMGSGSLLLTVGNELPNGHEKGAIKYWGQELNTTTYNLARMNLMMHGVSYENMDLRNADTLESDWPDGLNSLGIDEPRSFDAVVANPPYSAKWDNNDNKLKDARFSDYGKLAPSSKADFAFILHSLYHLNTTGTMAIVLPHGVLFRGAAELKIRQTIIEKNYLHAVIGLPANLFYGTSIPTTILVFKKNRTTKDVLFIDASNDFEKGKNQNRLTDEHISKIMETYEKRESVDKYASVVSFEDIKANDFNLNIPRYVDTFEEEVELDLDEINRLLAQDAREIAELEAQINEQLKLLGVDISMFE